MILSINDSGITFYEKWVKPSDVRPIKWWVFCKWSDHNDKVWDGMRILGFNFHRYGRR